MTLGLSAQYIKIVEINNRQFKMSKNWETWAKIKKVYGNKWRQIIKNKKITYYYRFSEHKIQL